MSPCDAVADDWIEGRHGKDPSKAGSPRTRDVTPVYEDDRITVVWDATLCIDTAICLQRLPRVLDVSRRPWVALAGATVDEIAQTISACPTGALRYEGKTVPAEVPDDPTTVEVPLMRAADL